MIERMSLVRLTSIFCGLILCCACASAPHPVPVVAAGTYNKYNKGVLDLTHYKVKSGDTLYSIAWRAGMKMHTLARINKISAPYRIYPGQVLRLKTYVSIQSRRNSSSATKKTEHRSHYSIKHRNNSKKRRIRAKKTKRQVVSHSTKQYVKSVPSKKRLGIHKSRTKLTWIWPTKGHIISGFSSKVAGNKGIDIAGHRNQAIHAASSGRVVYAGNALRGYGNLIIIKHNSDYLSAYAHNRRILVKEHQLVKAGQHIANMGETGTTSYRLHFEIRYKGKSVDPRKYLPIH